MDASDLALKMLEYEKVQRHLDALGDEIKAAVLELKETQAVGNVKARFSNGRRKLDWETPGKAAPVEIVTKYTVHIDEQVTVIPAHDNIDWGAVCKEVGFEPVVLEEGTPFVTIEVKEIKK